MAAFASISQSESIMCTPDTPLTEVAHLMRALRAKRALVHAEGTIIGVITHKDLLDQAEHGAFHYLTADVAYQPAVV